jgi:hypothetical protein
MPARYHPSSVDPALDLQARLATLPPPTLRRNPQDDIAALGLTAADIPALVELVPLWADLHHFERTADTPAMWVPLHACQALAELRAEIVVPTVLALLDALEEQDDQWYLELLPSLCARIGSSAIDALERFLGDPEHAEYPRITVVDALGAVAGAEPQARDRVVAILAAALERYEELPGLNAFIISGLADLDATEHADTIERAFAAGLVDEMSCGSWPDIAFELGVGPKPPRRRPPWETIAARPAATPSSTAAPSKRPAKIDKQARKRQRQARKKNRRK